MTAATLLANNIYRAAVPQATDETVSRLAKTLVPVIALVAVYFTLHGGNTIVALLLMGYSFVTQLLPTLLASLLPRNPVTKLGAMAGIVVGVATVAATSLTHTTIAALAAVPTGHAEGFEHRHCGAGAEPRRIDGRERRDPAGPAAHAAIALAIEPPIHWPVRTRWVTNSIIRA